MNDHAPTRRQQLAASTVAAISDLPGVARLVPSFREALTATTREFFGADDSQAAVVDIVTHGEQVLMYIDMYTDGSRPAGEIVDDVHDRVYMLLGPEQRAVTELKVRILGIDRGQ